MSPLTGSSLEEAPQNRGRYAKLPARPRADSFLRRTKPEASDRLTDTHLHKTALCTRMSGKQCRKGGKGLVHLRAFRLFSFYAKLQSQVETQARLPSHCDDDSRLFNVLTETKSLLAREPSAWTRTSLSLRRIHCQQAGEHSKHTPPVRRTHRQSADLKSLRMHMVQDDHEARS